MDNVRLIAAIVLSLLVFVAWDAFFAPKEPVVKPRADEAKETIAAKPPAGPATAETAPPVAMLPAAAPGGESPPASSARTITVDTPIYTVKIAEKGAVFKSFVLKKYRQSIAPQAPAYELLPAELFTGTLKFALDGNSLPGLDQAVFGADLVSDAIEVRDGSREVVFSWQSPQGVVVEKKFVFAADSYMIDLVVTLKNGSPDAVRDRLLLSLMRIEPKEPSRLGFEGPCALIDNDVEQVKTKKIKKQNLYSGKVKWIAIQDRYFMTAVIPEKTDDASMRLLLTANNLLENQYLQAESVVASGTQQAFRYKLFFGPKSLQLLNTLDYDLNKAVNFGVFDFLAKPLLWLMNFLHDNVIPNYGLAIIVLTLLTKIILWPLGNKSYQSMNEMKKIQPLMTEIREKHKDDKRKMNEEMMSLYRTYKVNPLGGCLPMVVQIPVFFALYRMLYEAIELRHAPFFGWIIDLSAPDRLFSFDISIPFMEPPYGIPVLTIIMGATMLLQQKMSPPVGDPAQAKMMTLMPIVFTVIFINFSSGLVLYWLVNNLLSIAQQYYVIKKSA